MPQVVQTVTGSITPSSAFTRPNDTTAYAIGDLVANSTSAASVQPLLWRVGVADIAGGTLGKHTAYVAGVRLKLDNSTVTNAQFRVHLYKATPTFTSAGDNSAFATVVATGYLNWLGSFDTTIVHITADGVSGLAVPTDGAILPFHQGTLDPGAYVQYWGLIEARAAYTPKAQGVFTAELLVETS